MTNALSWIEISESALKNNIKLIRSKLNLTTKLMAMVKSNAYGHGIETVSIILASLVDWFGVNTIDEALSIRKLDIKNPILIAAPIPESEFETAAKNNISLAAHSLEYLAKLQKYPIKIHLKINTGMNRLGLLPNEIPTSIPHLEGIYTHFHSADTSKAATAQQLQRFLSINHPNVIRHAANSAATLNFPETHLDMVRIGHAIYGLCEPCTPVLSWKCHIVQVRKLTPDQTVGYGATWTTTKPMHIATLPIGFSDGLDRKLSNQLPFVGRIAMNYATILTNSRAKEGDIVDIIDPNQSATLLANKLSTSNYEIVSRLNPFIPKIRVK